MIIAVSTYVAWNCPHCYWAVNFWTQPLPFRWSDMDPDTQRNIRMHWITHSEAMPYRYHHPTPHVWISSKDLG